MTLVVCWLAFPLVLAILSTGLGLLVERVAGLRLQTSLLLPCGFALLVVVTTVATSSGGTAGLATPAAVVLALTGLIVGARGRGWHVSRPGAAAAFGVLAVAAAPVVLSGEAGFAGYTQLDDISTFLALGARAIGHGRDLAGLAPSTYEATLAVNLSVGYPLGSFVPLAAARPLVGQDMAWLWQPYLTYMLGMLALALWALTAETLRDRRLRAIAVFLAAQPALLYAYALQGGVKELATAALVALGAALGAALLREPQRARLAVPLGTTAAALVCVLAIGAVAYLGPLAVGIAAGWALRRPRLPHAIRSLGLAGGGTALVTLALALPVLSAASKFASAGGNLLQNKVDLGNLYHPLDWKQLLGIWPAGDFRNGIGQGRGLAYVLMVVLAVAALVGAAWTLRRRVLGPGLFAVTVVGALVGIATFGSSPWVTAKSLAIGSPAVVLLAVLGCCLLLESGLRTLGAVGIVAIAAGILWSNWLAYHDVKLAPRDRLVELASIGGRFAGQGPTMINEYEPYGARYFLRRTDPEAPAELRRRVVPLRSGEGLGKDQWAPLDEFQMPALLVYRTIVVRRSPAESRPPVQYALRLRGRYYDVWQRAPQPSSRVLSYSIFGDQTNAGERPQCGLVRRLADLARRRHARLAAAVRAAAAEVDVSTAAYPSSWIATPGHLYPTRPGAAQFAVAIVASGAYDAWVQGSFARGLEVWIDGRRLGSVRNELSFAGQWIHFGARVLAPGSHAVELRYPGGSLRPGSGQQPQDIGTFALAPRAPRTSLLDVAPARASALCGTPLDWLEVVAPGA